jgi:signal transduction histidine kinase
MAKGDYTRRVRATTRDEVGELAQAFNLMAGDLGDADRQRRELVANVSHELRTPITALSGVLENLVDGVEDPDPATLKTALQQTERLATLVDELLDLSRLDAGAITLHRTEFSLTELLAEVVSEAALVRGVRFEVSVTPAEAVVTADRGRLFQVVANLLENAVRHGPAGGVVRILAETRVGEVRIDVCDEGPGIAPADRTRVFERFTRGERPTGGGTGLGLAIARWAVELHGGSIAVAEPSAGSGGRIRVTLPTA